MSNTNQQLVSRFLSAVQVGRLISGARRHAAVAYHDAVKWWSGTWLHFRRSVREDWLRYALDLKHRMHQPFPSVCFHGSAVDNHDAHILRSCFAKALTGPSRLPAEVRAITGMSGQKYRSFINEFVASLSRPRYLEIGSWAGSTAAAALYGNRCRAVCIDNWSQFGGPRSDFFANMSNVLSKDIDFDVIEKDFRAVDYSQLGTFNVYLFDGPHNEDDQYDGIALAQAALDDLYILIVDDWNWNQVRLGTLRALRDIRCKIEHAIELRTTFDNTQPVLVEERSDGYSVETSDWHNGYFIGLIRKTSKPARRDR